MCFVGNIKRVERNLKLTFRFLPFPSLSSKLTTNYPTTPSGRTQRCSSFGVPTSSLRPRDRCPRDTALAATPGTGQLQTGAYGIPSAEKYGAIVPESTRSGIKPARPSPFTVVIHTTAARPAVPSVNSRPSLVFCCSLHLLEHSTQRHSICTIKTSLFHQSFPDIIL